MNAPSSSKTPPVDARTARRFRALAWGWLGILALLAAALFLHVRLGQAQIDTDLLALLPVDERKPHAEAALKTLAQHGERELVLLLEAPDAATAQRAARQVRESLRDAPLTPQAVQARLDALRTLYFPHRAGFITDQDTHWIAETDSAAHTERALSLAYQSFAGGPLNWRDDPFGFFNNWLLHLSAASPVRPVGDTLMVRSAGKHYAVLPYQLTQSAFSSELQTRLAADLARAQDDLSREFPEAARLLRAGVVLHATAAAQRARLEMSLIGSASLLCCVALAWVIFRRFSALRLILLSLATGALAALSLTWLVFDRLHALTVVFGTSLIGVAVDYGVLVLAQHLGASEAEGRWSRCRRLLPPLALVLVAPALAYCALLLMPFPGMRQMACFAVSGIVGAWLTVMLWHPWLLPVSLPETKLAERLMRAQRHWPRWQATPAQWLAAALFALLLGGGILQLKTDDNIRSLVSSDPELLREQIAVGKVLQLPSPAQLFLISGDSPEEVLQHEEALLARLSPFLADGKLTG
ncbi:MAG: hypothetical protein LBU76_07940, partial [Azoarcus sp.]|nr:hypothetical protein [Azoarcus sp.]